MFYIGDPGNNAGIINLNFRALHLFSRTSRFARRLSQNWRGFSGCTPHRLRVCHVIFIIAMR
ncbi:hypothetical protein WL93_06695 [Burkholderia diffusa]|nr:hypothetical protein WL93_06695 [Burkholderia diffusa]